MNQAPTPGALWMMHVIGPDDIYPAPDHATAVEWCAALNASMPAGDVLCVAVPAIWIGTPEAHAEGLSEAVEGWTSPRQRPAPTAPVEASGSEGETVARELVDYQIAARRKKSLSIPKELGSRILALLSARPLALEGQHSGGEDAAWTWLNGHFECDPADRDYSADEMVDAFMAGAGRYDIWAKALERIAGEHQHRSGYCQTDITVEPALTAEEAQTVARDALSTTPARAEAQDEGAAGVPEPLALVDAPRDGTTLRLWVRYPENGSWTPLDDARESWTIGFNNFDNTEDDRWQVVGWCWSHDYLVEAASDVEVLGWLPFHGEQARASTIPAQSAVEQYHARQIAEVMDEGDGFWKPCSGCQEGVDGYVSEKDYPFNRVFRCQPGGGCSECGGLGVLWDDTDYDAMAKAILADMETEANDHPPAADEDRVRIAVEALEPFAALAAKFGCWSMVEVCAPDPDNPSPVIAPVPLSAFENAAAVIAALKSTAAKEGEKS